MTQDLVTVVFDAVDRQNVFDRVKKRLDAMPGTLLLACNLASFIPAPIQESCDLHVAQILHLDSRMCCQARCY